MHRLRNKKKNKGEESDGEITSPPLAPTVPHVSMGGLLGGKKNKQAPQESNNLDFDFALPPTDDFRTSLLMPNLANRFSILKAEQQAAAAAAANGEDLPQPYKPFAALDDIAETSSLNGSLMSAHDRLTAKSDDRRASEDDTGSVMSRPRGGEGNVLFGGRQKVYRVTPRILREDGSSMEDLRMGRSVSSNDIPDYYMPRRVVREDQENDDEVENNKNRYTSSSTNSTPTTMARTSTAATSINSQPGSLMSPPNSATLPQSPTMATAAGKNRRPLYEQALDQQLQDQQSNTLGRLERLASLRRMGSTSPTRSDSPTFGVVSPSTSPNSRARSAKKSSPEIRTLPPTVETPPADDPAVFSTFDFGITPSSPPKGLKTQFPMNGPFSPGNLDGERGRGRQQSPALSRLTSPAGSSLRQASSSPELFRHRALSPGAESQENRSTFLRSGSSSERSSLDPDIVIQNIGDELDNATRDIGSSGSDEISPVSLRSRFPDHPIYSRPVSPVSEARASSDDDAGRTFFNSSSLKPKHHDTGPASPKFAIDGPGYDDHDSPTLPPGQGGGLGLLIRQRLRSDSGSSSNYAASTYTRMSRVSRYGVAAAITRIDTELSSGSSAGNMWQYDEFSHNNHLGVEDDLPSSSSIHPPPSPNIPSRFITPPDDNLNHITVHGRNSEDDDRQQGKPRFSEDDDRRPKLGKRSDTPDKIDEVRGRRRADSRAGDSRAGSRATSRAGTERSTSRAGGEPDQDEDWAQQLAFRRQLVQQNLRNQEKIHAHDTDGTSMKAGGGGILKTKVSNGGIKDSRPPIIMGPNGPMRGDTTKGKPAISPSPRTTPHPVLAPKRPPLLSKNSFGLGGSGSGHSSKDTSPEPPTIRKPPSTSQLAPTPVSISAGNTPRGQPMGWQEDWSDLPPRSAPASPRRAAPPALDLSKTTTNKGSAAPQRPTPPNINTSVLSSPPQLSGTRTIAPMSPAIILQQIESANSLLSSSSSGGHSHPLKKKGISKLQIGAPVLISKTSSFDTVELSPDSERESSLLRTPTSSASVKSRKRNNTIFSGWRTPVEKQEGAPWDDAKSVKSVSSAKLRKSKSDGGFLRGRAKKEEAPPMPRWEQSEKETEGGMI
jgi:hypothetical protein